MRPLRQLRPAVSTAALCGLLGHLALLLPAPAAACPNQAEKTTTLELDLGGGATARISVNVFDYEKLGVPEEHRPEDACSAWFEARLSDFPSIESRYGTARIADEIASLLAEWDVTSCGVSTWYHNDVGADFEHHELCRRSRYGFEAGRAHSLASEAYCWEPIEIEALALEEAEPFAEELADEDPTLEEASDIGAEEEALAAEVE
jgi:hypothetical protein